MRNRIPAYRLAIIDKLKMTHKPYANRIAEVMEIDGISDLQVESTMTDCIIELEKLLENNNKRIIESKANNNYDIYKNVGF